MKAFGVLLLVLMAIPARAQESAAPTATPAPSGASAASAPEPDEDDDLTALSSDYRLRLESKESRLTFGLFGTMSQFTREGVSLTGYTFEVVAGYAMKPKFAVQLALNQAVSMQNSITVLFTGLRSSAAYAITGEYIANDSTLNVNGRPSVSFRSGDKPLLSTDIGIDQYLFNGVNRIVPATGVSASLRYDRTIWNLRASAMARYGMLVISESQVPMMSAGLGLLFRF